MGRINERWAILLVLFACDSSESSVSTTADSGAPDATADSATEGGVVTGGTMGAECATNADCTEGLTCFTQLPTGEKLVKGVCSIACKANDDCAKSGSSRCLRESFCIERCTIGSTPAPSSLVGPLDPKKCHGRRDMGCSDTTGGGVVDAGGPAQYCFPICNDHSECPAGMKCHPGRGGCTTEPVGDYSEIGNPIASGEDTNAGCTNGFRATIGGVSFCSAACTRGVVPSCGWAGPGTKAEAVCSIASPGSDGYGDSAKCSRMCDCDSDCPLPLRCHTIKMSTVTESGRAGVCLPGDTGLVPACGDAGADGGDGG